MLMILTGLAEGNCKGTYGEKGSLRGKLRDPSQELIAFLWGKDTVDPGLDFTSKIRKSTLESTCYATDAATNSTNTTDGGFCHTRCFRLRL